MTGYHRTRENAAEAFRGRCVMGRDAEMSFI
jgi:hypothetical protein